MSATELAVLVGGLFVGYWVVAFFLRPPAGKSHAPPAEVQSHDEWHRVLDVPADASVEQIREAYRFQMSQYHPDKVASLGEEIRTVAERKAKEITAAYRAAMHLRGVDD